MFNTDQSKIKDFLSDLTYEKIHASFALVTFHRGLDYYKNGHVEEVVLNDPNTLIAQVLGSLRYSVRLELRDHHVMASCSCPVEGWCKHIAAVLLFCIENLEIIVESEGVVPATDDSKVEQYLNTLQKRQLVKLVLQFAPDNFKERITLKDVDTERAQKIFQRVSSQIKSLMHDFELLHDPCSFEEVLAKHFEKVSGIWDKVPEVGDLIVESLEKINDLMYEGYLYDDYHDVIFEGIDFGQLVRHYILSLSFNRRLGFIERMQEVLSTMEYAVCDNILSDRGELFSRQEQPELKKHLLEQVNSGKYEDAEDYFKLLSSDLNDEETEFILTSTCHTSDYLTLQLADFYKKRKNFIKAIEVIEAYLDKPAGIYHLNVEQLYLELIRLKHDTEQPGVYETAIEALNRDATIPILELAISCLPGQRKAFEKIMERNRVHEYLEYLESHKRIPEAVKLIKKSNHLAEETKFRFFLNHKSMCLEDASSYFTARIEKELIYTGNHHYYAIADTLRALKQIDRKEAINLAQSIRMEYRRRRNLVEAIRDI